MAEDNGKYRMIRRLAGGGMGEIYLAEVLGPAGFTKLVVLKRILPNLAEDPNVVAMFVNEARLAAGFDHPNIVRVYDFAEANDSFFYVMEYMHGDSLMALLRASIRTPGRLPLEHALTIALGMCRGLHFAHEKRGPDGKPLGLIHRDVTPGNVFITYEGEVKLLDFGIAKVLAAAAVTRSVTLKGKVAYMSPEQGIGASLDRRSDIFAIGIILYEMTTMTRLFRGAGEVETVNKTSAGEVTPPTSRIPGYPPALEAIVLRALARDREQRYATAMELHDALEDFAASAGLRTSVRALGQFVRDTTGDRPYPSTSEAPMTTESHPPQPTDPTDPTATFDELDAEDLDDEVETLVLVAGPVLSVREAPTLGVPTPVVEAVPPSRDGPARPGRSSRGVLSIGLAVAVILTGLVIAWAHLHARS